MESLMILTLKSIKMQNFIKIQIYQNYLLMLIQDFFWLDLNAMK